MKHLFEIPTAPKCARRAAIASCLILVGFLTVFMTFRSSEYSDRILPVVYGVMMVMYGLVGIYSSRGIRAFRHRVKDEDGFICPRCEYALTGLPEEGACPECGNQYVGQRVRWFWSQQLAKHAHGQQASRSIGMLVVLLLLALTLWLLL